MPRCAHLWCARLAAEDLLACDGRRARTQHHGLEDSLHLALSHCSLQVLLLSQQELLLRLRGWLV
jgi:hypothetical protein